MVVENGSIVARHFERVLIEQAGQFPAELAYIQIRSQKGTLNFPLEEFMCSTNLLPLSVRHAFVQRAS